LTISDSLLRQIVIDDDSVLAVVTEPFTHSTAGERCNVLEWGSLGCSGGDDNAVLHGIILLQSLHELGDGRTLLADSHVDAVKLLLLVVAVVPSPLVQHGIKSNRSLTGLAVTNDQLTLATANGNHGIDGLQTGLHRLVDRTARQNAGSLSLSTTPLLSLDRAFAVNWVTKGIDNTAKKFFTDWYLDLKRC